MCREGENVIRALALVNGALVASSERDGDGELIDLGTAKGESK